MSRSRIFIYARPLSVGDIVLLLSIIVCIFCCVIFFSGKHLPWGHGRDRAGDTGSGLPDTRVARALRALPQRDNDDFPPYRREAFGSPWADVDGNGCDTRNDILNRDLSHPIHRKESRGCVVLNGTLPEPYTGKIIKFRRGEKSSSQVQIDHVVPLSDAWKAGAWKWKETRRQEMANDPLNLLAVDGEANQGKGAMTADQWLPENKDFHCHYAARQIAVKTKWKLSVTPEERRGLEEIVGACPSEELPTE